MGDGIQEVCDGLQEVCDGLQEVCDGLQEVCDDYRKCDLSTLSLQGLGSPAPYDSRKK